MTPFLYNLHQYPQIVKRLESQITLKTSLGTRKTPKKTMDSNNLVLMKLKIFLELYCMPLAGEVLIILRTNVHFNTGNINVSMYN
jgi:hypothetical protein